jgi:hypothetical protein
MDIGRSFSYVTEDQEWVRKVLIGALISLIPIIGQFYLMGFAIEVLRNILQGRETPLPEPTDDFGDKLVKGILIWVIAFIYFLPLTIVSTCSGAGGAIFSSAIDDPDAVNAVTGIWSGLFGCLSIVIGVLIGLLMPFVWSKYAETGEFGEAFKFSEIFAMLRDNIGQAFIATLVSALAGILAFVVGLILCGIGLIVTLFYAQLITVFLYGSVYREAKAKAL